MLQQFSAPVGRKKSLTRLQRALLAHVTDLGGEHVSIGPATRAVGHLSGYTWEGVHLSLQSLLRAGLLQKSGRNDGFYSLPTAVSPSPAHTAQSPGQSS